MELSKVAVNIVRDGEKEVEHNMSTLFLQLTQVLISPGLYLKKSRTVIKVELAWNNLRNNPEGLWKPERFAVDIVKMTVQISFNTESRLCLRPGNEKT